MKRTKIICTMGPNTNDREVMKQLALNGMDIARFNFSHGDHEEQKGRVDLLKSVREEIGLPIAMLLDTKGPEIRTGAMKEDKKVTLVAGNTFTLTTREVFGDDTIAQITYTDLPKDVVPGSTILIDDGLIELRVQSIQGEDIICEIINGGELGQKKGVNVPDVEIHLPSITEKDKADILFGIEQGYDFIAASFVRNAQCIRDIKEILRAHDSDIKIIAKIENRQGIDNIDEIIEVADGIMVARGDMGVEIPAEEVPHVQKMIIRKCNERFKPVITATQMLDSMMRNPRPTRAEVTDVANAIYDGTDVVMLSGETAQGKYPVEAVKMMSHIAESTEANLDHSVFMDHFKAHSKQTVSGAVSYASVTTAENLNATAIIAPTISGFTARIISKYKPSMQVIGLSPSESVLRKMQMYWGVKPLKSIPETSTDDIIRHAIETSEDYGYIHEGDTVVVTAGVPTEKNSYARKGITNVMRVIVVD
ncbi:MAG: pyruvate kinase [Lachnospiraceae bacterium]|nr:pyruvate kinase [Lachnospiraceae bacterium]